MQQALEQLQQLQQRTSSRMNQLRDNHLPGGRVVQYGGTDTAPFDGPLRIEDLQRAFRAFKAQPIKSDYVYVDPVEPGMCFVLYSDAQLSQYPWWAYDPRYIWFEHCSFPTF